MLDRGADYATRPFEWVANLLPDANEDDTPSSGYMDDYVFSAALRRDKKIQELKEALKQ